MSMKSIKKLSTTTLFIFGLLPSSALAQQIPVAEVLFGADVELCLNGASGASNHVATIYHTLDATSAGKISTSNLDGVCATGGNETETLSGYSRGSGGFIYASFEEQICDESNTIANGGAQEYEGVYRFAPPSLPFGQSATYNFNFLPQNWSYIKPDGTRKHVNGSEADGTKGGGTYIYESKFSSGWEGGRRVLYHRERYASEKVLDENDDLDPGSFDFHRFKKYDIDSKNLISVRVYRSAGQTVDKLYIACTPSGGQCSNCP